MPNFTTNLNLEKPLGTEYYDIEVHNENSDKIDAFSGTVVKINDIVDNLTTASATKPLSANMGKKLKDDEWKINAKVIGSSTVSTDLNTILEKGFYKSDNGSFLFTNLPPGKQGGAFSLTVVGIADAGRYGTQTLFDYITTKIWHRVNTSTTMSVPTWTPWVEIMTSSTPPIPIGGVLLMADNTSPADKYPGTTWSIIADDKVLRGGNQSTVNATGGANTKTIDVANLPAFSVTRGTQDITGTFHRSTENESYFESTGAFTEESLGGDGVGGFGDAFYRITFTASRSWSGSSSSVGSGTALNVENAYHKTVNWKRLT